MQSLVVSVPAGWTVMLYRPATTTTTTTTTAPARPPRPPAPPPPAALLELLVDGRTRPPADIERGF